MRTFNLLLLLTGLIVVVKLALVLHWSTSLHRRHGGRYSYSAIFMMLFRPNWPDDMDDSLWNDLQPIQDRNLLSSILLLTLSAGILAVNAAIYEVNR